MRQFGGTQGQRTLAIPGDAQLTPGEEVVLFLVRAAATTDAGARPERWALNAFSQAKFRLEADPVGGSTVLTRSFDGASFVPTRSALGHASAAGPSGGSALRLDDFRSEIQSYARPAAAPGGR